MSLSKYQAHSVKYLCFGELFGFFHPWYLYRGSENEDSVSPEYNILQIRKQGREMADVLIEFSEQTFNCHWVTALLSTFLFPSLWLHFLHLIPITLWVGICDRCMVFNSGC